RAATGQPVTGWLSPSVSESLRTLDVLAEAGVRYVLDWVNDDWPYELRARGGALWALPCSHELDDLHLIATRGQTTWDYVDQVLEQARVLVAEAERCGGRVLCL